MIRADDENYLDLKTARAELAAVVQQGLPDIENH